MDNLEHYIVCIPFCFMRHYYTSFEKEDLVDQITNSVPCYTVWVCFDCFILYTNYKRNIQWRAPSPNSIQDFYS